MNIILREINFGESSCTKNAILRTINFVNLVNISLQKVEKFRASKRVKMADFVTQDWPILISRKIWVTQNFFNFHTTV